MANRNNSPSKNAIYAPGELGRVRDKLGVTDDAEAKRMAQLLGGQVGTERNAEPEPSKSVRSRREPFVEVASGGKKRRRIDIAPPEEEKSSKPKQSGPYPGDDPEKPLRLGYSERIKMDQYAGQMMFEIKNSLQVLASMLSFFREPVDSINPRFVTVRMNEYYNKVERLVTAARNLFPKNNRKRNIKLKRASPFVYKVLDTIRSWDIEQIARNIAELQSHPRNVKATDFIEVLRGFYKPLFILDELNTESIKTAFKLIYKILYLESPMDAKDKYQEIIRNIIAYLGDIRRNVQFGLYPLLMKLISDRYLIYERIFIERRRRFMAFLNITENEQLNADDLNPQQVETIDVEAIQKNIGDDDSDDIEEIDKEEPEELIEEEEDQNDPKVIERKAREDAEKAQQKAMEQGKTALETLFPKAKWDKLEEFPDMFPYFANVYNLRQGYELIAPSDPIQQVAIFLHILEDIFIGMRYVNFGTTGPDGSAIRVNEELVEPLNNWRQYIEDSFSRGYLPRLTEYCRLLENNEDSRMSPYARKIFNELHWMKRLYFLPYYKFESMGPPPFTKKDVIPIYSEIRKLRKSLTSVAKGIEMGMRAGGSAVKAPCAGINNPWESYNFQVPNPISKRLDLMLPPDKRINATLIFFSLSTLTVLDHLVNNENSWAYSNRIGSLFRSVRDEGVTPMFGVNEKLDADKFFKDSLKKPQS